MALQNMIVRAAPQLRLIKVSGPTEDVSWRLSVRAGAAPLHRKMKTAGSGEPAGLSARSRADQISWSDPIEDLGAPEELALGNVLIASSVDPLARRPEARTVRTGDRLTIGHARRAIGRTWGRTAVVRRRGRGAVGNGTAHDGARDHAADDTGADCATEAAGLGGGGYGQGGQGDRGGRGKGSQCLRHQSLSLLGWLAARPIPNTDSQPVPSYGLLEPKGRKPGNWVGNLLRAPGCSAQTQMPDGFPPGIHFNLG